MMKVLLIVTCGVTFREIEDSGCFMECPGIEKRDIDIIKCIKINEPKKNVNVIKIKFNYY